MYRKDLTDERFGKLTVLGFIGHDRNGDSTWACKCDCGNEIIVSCSSLKSGNTKSCGCSRRDDISGKRFGRLTVLEYAGSNKTGNALWLCECDCGQRTIVIGLRLKNGATTSCGCLQRELTKEMATVHGLHTHPLYSIWVGMRTRCRNEKSDTYYRYGGRGISVCNEWNNFKNFYDWSISHGWEPGLTIDRNNNDGNYCPENCRWVDNITQQNNRCNNHMVTFNNETHTIAEWARTFGIKYDTLWQSVKRNGTKNFEKYFTNRKVGY